MQELATGEAVHVCPQPVVKRRQEQLVAIVEQRVGSPGNHLARAVAQVDVVERDARDALFLYLLHHGLACSEDALAVGVIGELGQATDHVLLNLLRKHQRRTWRDCQR